MKFKGLGFWLVVLVSGFAGVGGATKTGFMSGATHISSGTEHRW